MDSSTLLGTVAGTLTTFALLPQIVRIVRLRSAEDISAATFVTTGVGILLWIAYGLRIRSAPVIFFNGVTLVFVVAVLVLKARYRKR